MTGRRSALVTKATVQKAVKGILAAGITEDRIVRVVVTPEGVSVVLGDPEPSSSSRNEWDEVLRR
ncbi:hypothetical protein [Ancylobacter radicis]|uniref:Uncharacterized protein n=1 Tax=Ancylobacter radicis TaxID=2836179 RepID=A0ABS5R342_9HYPH|nr:hypothetical protein [Ancylobacter radicis]MBS9476074.1 hypothetical protein [Ancylobacter radicis]